MKTRKNSNVILNRYCKICLTCNVSQACLSDICCLEMTYKTVFLKYLVCHNWPSISCHSVVLFNTFVNVIFWNLYFGRLWLRRYFSSKLTEKHWRMLVFLYTISLLKLPPNASHGKPKLHMCLSKNFDFVFTNLLNKTGFGPVSWQ